MKLYYAPGACSLADHIALHQADLPFEHERVDLKVKQTEGGADFTAINPKGYVPALILDTGETLTENVAILDWISDHAPALKPTGAMGRTRQLETLSFISTEIHKSFKPFFAGGSDEEKTKAKEVILKRMTVLADAMQGEYIFGGEVGVADCYLFVMLFWARNNAIQVPAALSAFHDRMAALPAVQAAMKHEGLI